MEARASLKGTSVPKAFVAVVIAVTGFGLAAMGGYIVRTNGGGAAATQGQPVHAAPGTVLRQDNPARASAELPSYIPQAKSAKGTRILQDDPYFIAQYSAPSAPAANDGLMTRNGGHKELP